MYEIAAGGGESPVVLMTGSATGGNFVSENFPVDPPFVVSNTNAYVILSVVFPQQGITGFQVNYQLQVSPAPDTATFNDVPVGSPFFQFIEALAASGITAGCGGGNFCPDAPVTRGQIAVFLSKALGLYFPN
jgi:hypothetical protein